MKKYILQDKVINLKTDEVMIFFTGKDGYVHDENDFYYCEGYKQRKFIEKKIKDEIKFHARHNEKYAIDESHCLESGKYLHHYTILEVSA